MAKKIIIIGDRGGGGIGKTVREAIMLSKLKNSGVVLLEFKPGKSEIRELADQLNALSEQENIVMREFTRIQGMTEPFIPNKKERSRYKRNLKYKH